MKSHWGELFALKYFVIFICIALVFAVIFSAVKPNEIPTSNGELTRKQAEILSASHGNKSIKLTVEIANSPQERSLGLSNRSKLETGFGMYFVQPVRELSSFWMKDMRFPIDIIWIDRGVIVGIDKNCLVPKDQNNIPTFKSPKEVTNVLEVDAGFSDQNNIKVGDQVKLIN